MDKYDKLKGCFIGLAIGDALGVPLEFHERDELPEVRDMIGQGPFNLNPGEWTDDTSMALCITDSLIRRGEFNPTDIMHDFLQWWQFGLNSHTGRCFDIGTTTQIALGQYSYDNEPYAGSKDIRSSGNGAIMRLAPIPIFYNINRFDCVYYGIQQSKLTHASPDCIDQVSKMSSIMYDLLNGISFNDLVQVEQYKIKPRSEVKSSGYVVDTLEAAIWAICNTDNFEDALILAINLADDSDTVGAVTGQIAGAIYGYNAIPERWLEKLVWRDKLEITFDKLLQTSKSLVD